MQPTKQNNYLKTEFWSQNFDESVKNWKTGGQCVSFEFKPIDLIADTEREKHTVTFCFYQETPWKRTTEYYSLNVVDGTAKIGDTTIQATDAGNGWYRLTVPFSILEPCETTAVNCSIDLISFRWINHSIAIRNVRICKEATGDLNGDGKTDKSDVLMLQGYLVSNGYMKLDLWKEADFDYNCELNAIDLALMNRAILNQR